MANFCSNCGVESEKSEGFCPSCGNALLGAAPARNQVLLLRNDRRFIYGSAEKFSEAATDIYVDPDSDEIKRSKSPFRLNVIPKEGDLVPGDCVWSSIKYPGPLPKAVLERSWEENLLDDSWVTARPMAEINQVLGQPVVQPKDHIGVGNPDGGYFLLIYKKSFGFLGRQVRVGGIWFDNYRVAMRAENNVSQFIPQT